MSRGVEIARLADIALAEVGVTHKMDVDGKWRGYISDYPMAFRAVLLAYMHLYGPDHLTFCVRCGMTYKHEGCCRLPVREALMGRTCGVS